MGRLDGKVALITGAANGMGLAGSRLFAQEGAKVAATDIEFDTLQKEVAAIVAKGGEAVALKLDVTVEEDWKSVVKETIDKFGKIDILVNNAGIGGRNNIENTGPEEWEHVLVVDITGVFLGMKHVIPIMKKNGGGSIVNTSSVAALIGDQVSSPAYSAAKGGVRSLTKQTAVQYAKDKIRVNSVHPGFCYTKMVRDTGLTKEQFAEWAKSFALLPPHASEGMDMAYAYLYLASDESRMITGIELPVDGCWISW